MRVSKVLGVLVAGALFVTALSTTSVSQADEDDAKLVKVSCAGGKLTATPTGGWHANIKAPWSWDKGSKTKLEEGGAEFAGSACEGTLKAFVCKETACKGPIKITVH